jgi:hypothetical protein
MKADDPIPEIQSLTAEELAPIAGGIPLPLNPAVSVVDQRLADLAATRLQVIRTGTVKPVAGEDVFGEIWRRFN